MNYIFRVHKSLGITHNIARVIRAMYNLNVDCIEGEGN